MKKHVPIFNAMKHFFTLFSFLIFCFSLSTKAQTSCEQSVKQGEESYNNGDYENSIQTLEKSIKECSLSPKMKENAFELLAKSYLEEDNIPLAEATVVKLLKNNPNYELKETDNHEDFNILVNKFEVHPLFSIGIRNTGMEPTFKTTKTYTVLENVNYNAPYKTTKTLLLYSVWVEYEFKKSISLNADVINYNISYDRSFLRGTDWGMAYKENLSFVEVPVYLKKYFMLGKNVMPYAALGMGYLRVLQSTANAEIIYTNEDTFNGTQNTISKDNDIDVLSMRNRNSLEWLVGAGVGFKFRNLGIYIDGRYSAGVNSLTNSANRFNNKTLTNDYFYVDNSVKLNKYELGISISYTLKNLIKKSK
jgi:hypothetical protein